MRIYTRGGDDGDTGLFGGGRVSKDDARIEASGTVDELGAALGQARSQLADVELSELLLSIQHRLFDVGSELATPDPKRLGTVPMDAEGVAELERWIDRFEAQLPPLSTFILAGGTPAACSLHVARGVCRRAERRVVTLIRRSGPDEPVSGAVLAYLNRLGDLLFVLSRVANSRAGVPDVPWQKLSAR